MIHATLALLLLFLGVVTPAAAEAAKTVLEAEGAIAPLSMAQPSPSGAGGRLVNADGRPYTLDLRCGELAWSAGVDAFETVALAAPSAGACELVVRETKSTLALSGAVGELRIEAGALRESVRTLRWSIVRATYGDDGPWPDGVVPQWAVAAEASTEYTADSWSAGKAAGAPDTVGCGDSPTAWAPLEMRTEKRHWILLRYPKRVRAVGARLHVTLAPGAVKEIQARTGSGWETVWSGPDPTRSCPAILAARFAEEVDTDTIRVVVDLSHQDNWFELDAVELLGKAL